jgi:hypothetical protein
LLAIDPPHAIHQEDQIPPDSDELKPSRLCRPVIAGSGLMAARANRTGSFPRPDPDDYALVVVGETGAFVDESRNGMALIQNLGKTHEMIGRI